MKDRIQFNKLCDMLADLIELEMLGGRVPKKNKIRIDVTLDMDVTARYLRGDP